MKYYKYTIYRLYNLFSKNQQSNWALTTVSNFMTIVHFSQILGISFILIKIFPQLDFTAKVPEISLLFAFFAFSMLYKRLISKKGFIDGIREKYRDESASERKKRSINILLFIAGSIILLSIGLKLYF